MKNIESLKISHAFIHPEISAITSLPLTQLFLVEVCLNDDAVQALSTVIRESTSLKSLCIHPSFGPEAFKSADCSLLISDVAQSSSIEKFDYREEGSRIDDIWRSRLAFMISN
jgi:hypothetical protein